MALAGTALVLATTGLAEPVGLRFAGGTAQAAEQAVRRVKLDERQIAGLGLQTVVPRSAAQSVLTDLPARAVVPPSQLHVVSAPLAGVITQVAVSPSQMVRAGQVLVQMASPAVAELRRGASQAAIQLALAERTARRDQQLFEEGLIAESRHRASQSALAESRLQQAERREALKLAGVAGSAGVQGSLSVRAPIDGTILELTTSPSSRVEASTPLVRIAQTDPLWLEIQMLPRDAAKVAVGTVVSIKENEALAKVFAVSGELAPDTQTVLVRAQFANVRRLIRPGQFLSVSVPLTQDDGTGLWQLPTSAIVRVDDKPVVFVRDATGYRILPVQVRESTGIDSYVAAALAVDSAVVSIGAGALKAIVSGVGATASP